MQFWDIMIIVFVAVLALGAALYFLNRWASRKAVDQQEMVERHKTTVSIYVIDKKKDKVTNANFPKAVQEQMPKYARMMKMPLVKAKVGPQIMTLMCEKNVFDALPVKKTVKVEMAGMYIAGMKGMKSKGEMAQLRKAKKAATEASNRQPLPWYKNIAARLMRK